MAAKYHVGKTTWSHLVMTHVTACVHHVLARRPPGACMTSPSKIHLHTTPKVKLREEGISDNPQVQRAAHICPSTEYLL